MVYIKGTYRELGPVQTHPSARVNVDVMGIFSLSLQSNAQQIHKSSKKLRTKNLDM